MPFTPFHMGPGIVIGSRPSCQHPVYSNECHCTMTFLNAFRRMGIVKVIEVSIDT